MYGSGSSSDHTSGRDIRTSGEGSHLSSATQGSRMNPSGSVGYGNDSLRPGLPRANASNASIKSGVQGDGPPSSLTDPLTSGSEFAGNTNKPLPDSPAARMTGAGVTGSGLTGSSLPDRSVGRYVLPRFSSLVIALG